MIFCLECKKYFNCISWTHLKKHHNMTTKEYKNKYPNAIMRDNSGDKNPMYGVHRVGENAPHFNHKHSEKTKQQISESLRGEKNPNYGRKGEAHPMFGVHKYGEDAPFYNHKHSEKTKQQISNALKGKTRDKFTETHKQNMSKNHADFSGDKNPMYGVHRYGEDASMWNKHHTNESKQQMRLSRIKEIEMKYGKICPNYNLKACEFFENLNEHFDLNGIHAGNNDEFQIKELGYFVDYYELDLNMAIEYDEKHHYNSDGTLKDRDIQRQNEITDFLGCKFIRINESKSKWQLLPIDAIESLVK